MRVAVRLNLEAATITGLDSGEVAETPAALLRELPEIPHRKVGCASTAFRFGDATGHIESS